MEPDKQKTKASVGDTVKVRLGNGEVKSYTVVLSEKTDPGNGFISNMCPIGRALIGGAVGEKKKYLAGDREFEVEILEILKK